MKSLQISIGTKVVGRGFPPLIVAELSANHNANLDRALRIVRAAAESGAHAIKLQTFTPDALTIDSNRPEFFIDDPGGLWHGRRLLDLYREAHTPWEWHQPIFASARAAGMACISTACDIASLEFLVSIGIDAIKIASFELIHIPLIEAAAKSGKPILLSMGMASLEELDEAVSALRTNGCDQFIVLKCTSAYPSSEDDAHVSTMTDIRARYGCEVGLSDHTLKPFAAFAATSLGAIVVEKHFTTARGDGGLDAAFSLEPAEMRELVDGTSAVWRSLGNVQYGHLSSENASLRERPSIYAIRAVKKGEKFNQNTIRIIRPASGLAPKHFASLIGKTCAMDIAAGAPMSWDHVDIAEPRVSETDDRDGASEYLQRNAAYWSNTYNAPNVESFIFRFYGRILKFDYGIDGSKHERLLDFGCGQGGALNFFDKLGFNCFGVDIAANDIRAAQKTMPHIARQLATTGPRPSEAKRFFGGNFDIVISIQTLEFLSDSDFAKAIKCLWNNMKPGAKIYASMSGWNMYYRHNGTYAGDGLWHVKFKTSRVDYDLFVNFAKDKEDMKNRFSLFKPVYLDFYDSSFREEGSEFRYTFFGIKE
jgi:pseudaminic acid synthase